MTTPTRFHGNRRCPICGGADDDPRGEGLRCSGYEGDDARYIYCTRKEHAGRLHPETSASLPMPTWRHWKGDGPCRCGESHGNAIESPKPAPKSNGTHRQKRGRKLAEFHFPYVDENGSSLYRETRLEFENPDGGKPIKDVFLERSEGDSENGPIFRGYAGCMRGVRRVPLDLPTLLDAPPGESVFIVEGAKKARRLQSLGLVATSKTNGAATWPNDLTQYFTDKDVVILPDENDVGRRYAESAAKSLSAAAKSVRIVRLPGLAEKQDVVDWLDNGGTVDQLKTLAFNAKEWTPPAEVNALSSGVRSAVTTGVETFATTDLGNAQRLVHRFGHEIRFNATHGVWLVWDGRRWREDDNGEVFRLAKRVVRLIGSEASEAGTDAEAKALLKWALESESRRRIDSMIALAWSEPGVAITSSEMDVDAYLLNVENGTIDLRSGEIYSHRSTDLLSNIAKVKFDPTATCPKWDAFIDRITEGEKELAAFLRRAAGYSITGDVGEHCLFFLHGTGRNGKTTYLETLRTLLGHYGASVDPVVISHQKNEQHPTGLTDLDGRRFVSTEEVDDGKRLAEGLVKRLTGGGVITARRMHKNFYEFKPTHKIFLAANHAPEIRGMDEGIWSRVYLVPFKAFIPESERIKNFTEILVSEEGPGILNWLIAGCLEWQRLNGLNPPESVRQATQEYRSSMDQLAGFIAERCVSHLAHPDLKTQARTNKDVLYDSYLRWSKTSDSGEPLTGRQFGSEMERRGYVRKPSNGRYFRLGITLNDSTDSTEASHSSMSSESQQSTDVTETGDDPPF